MAGCKCENWTLEELSSSLQNMHKENKIIVVPMFQRGKRWKKQQEQKFIDSLIKGYPVGTMLFYETYEDDKWTYILVDGLQRGNSIKKYMTNPTEFFYDDSISDDFCASILELVHQSEEENYVKIRNILTTFIKEQKTFKNLQYYSVAMQISETFSAGFKPIGKMIDVIRVFFEDRQALYDKIASTVIPVIVYAGDENNLPEIFDRINSQGTPLDQYEVYAAAWPVKQKYTISNAEVIENVVRKYDAFTKEDYQIHGYSREEMRTKKQVNAFEYLFGLGKYLVHKYEIVSFNMNLADDTVNPIAFELMNACLNDSDKIKVLYKNFVGMDIDAFEKALCTAIDFVNSAILVITKFKGNSRNSNKKFHSKYQILSMVSTTFKEMYAGNEYSGFSDTWAERKSDLSRNLVQYYVYDILTNYWSEGGTNKIHSAAKPNRYRIEISDRAWMATLDSFFERSILRAEKKNIANPKSEEYVFLNCIYLNIFTAMDQLSIDKFDVEHIAPKEQMRKLIEACSGEGLAVSCVANLCYLPETANRSKGAKNFYQDKKYLEHINLEEVEYKYSFTEEDDLEWMDMPYEQPEDFVVLKEYYADYCTKRFDKMKHLFCESMGIGYDCMEEDNEPGVVIPEIQEKQELKEKKKRNKFSDKCVGRLVEYLHCELVKSGRNAYTTASKKEGFLVTTSKMYNKGGRERYWFAYRTNPLRYLDGCEKKYIVYGCRDENTLIMMSVEYIEKYLDCMRVSRDDQGNIAHWHIEFYKDANNHLTWMMSKPESYEISIDEYCL